MRAADRAGRRTEPLLPKVTSASPTSHNYLEDMQEVHRGLLELSEILARAKDIVKELHVAYRADLALVRLMRGKLPRADAKKVDDLDSILGQGRKKMRDLEKSLGSMQETIHQVLDKLAARQRQKAGKTVFSMRV